MSSQPLSAPAPAAAPAASSRVRPHLLLATFAVSTFASAFLLFLVQPLFGRMALPLLGGAPAVWNACMLFFQAALLGGYLYAHLTTRYLDVRKQAGLHLLLLAAAGLLLPVSLAGAEPEGGGEPVAWLLWTMLTTVGPPFLVLSGTGPMLQRWFSSTTHRDAADPYRLYAASNLGSALALLAYPILLEPRLRLAEQSGAWTAGYVLLALLVASCAGWAWHQAPPAARPAEDAADAKAEVPISIRERAIWVGLAFIPSSLLLGATTHVTTDLTPAPLLWVLPLALYLLSFTFVFARRPLIPHAWMVAVQPSFLAVGVFLLVDDFIRIPKVAIPLHLLLLFVTAMVCHGELARRRPAASRLTEFYLWLSVGGVMGGIFNVLVAPVAFPRVWEYSIVLALACLARPWAAERATWKAHAWGAAKALALAAGLYWVTRGGAVPFALYLLLAAGIVNLLAVVLGRDPLWLAVCLGGVLLADTASELRRTDALLATRSFFGAYEVREVQRRAGEFHVLMHGSTMHGAQATAAETRREPLTYYLRRGPLGKAFEAMEAPAGDRRVAVVGLGSGTAAAYAAAGDRWTFYEIDPGIEAIARDTSLFTYLPGAPADARVVLGDARLSLARAEGELYDMIVLDAFTSDAIPIHLLTLDALDVYLSRLAPGGLLAIHTSNRYLDLDAVVARLAKERGLVARLGRGPRSQPMKYEIYSTWIILARSDGDLGPIAGDRRWETPPLRDDVGVWTDDFSSIWSVFRW